MPSSRERNGFTILELILTLVLISIVAAVSIATYFSRGEVTLEKASILLARDLRSVQNRSAYLGESTRVEFFVDGSGYRVLGREGTLVRDPRTSEPFVRRYSDDGVFEGVTILEARFGRGRALEFDARGAARSGGFVDLAFGDEHRRVAVEKITGDIRILGSTSHWIDPGY